MIPVYNNSSELEKLAKDKFAIPQFLMMENAARSMADFILQKAAANAGPQNVVIACGKGNNGGDGYALARLLQDKLETTLLSFETPTAEEARAQYEMCQRLGIKILSAENPDDLKTFEKACKSADFIVDCLYGTGFHGELKDSAAAIISCMNKGKGLKIACDISSGLAFNADYTITMGCQKLSLFSDKAKAVSGEIILADLGISRRNFQAQVSSKIFLIEADDRILPLRKNRAAHKGTYGHTSVLCGDKAGAAILSATAAMNFGSGLTSLVKTSASDLNQFKISPSLMVADSIPAKTTCIALGSGFSDFSDQAADLLTHWFENSPYQALVLDAGILTSPKTPELLSKLNSFDQARIILTPHLAELSKLLENCGAPEHKVSALAEYPELKIEAGLFLTKRFPHTTVIMKSANTFIASGDQTFIIADGVPSLAKGGSGDILAGMAAALLAQGYSAKDAAITAAEHHAQSARNLGEEAYNLTPEALISKINL